MKSHSLRDIACAAVLLVCIIGLICTYFWKQSLENEAGSLMREMQGSNIKIVSDAGGIALSYLAKNQKMAVTKALELGWDAWNYWPRATVIKHALEANAVNLNNAMRWQSIYSWAGGIAAAVLIFSKIISARRLTKNKELNVPLF